MEHGITMTCFAVILLILSVLQLALSVPLNGNDCMKGPNYWCKDEYTARKCGVLEFCRVNNLFQRGSAVRKETQGDVKPVQIDLYYEALCGGCRKFIVEQLYPAYQKLYSSGIFEVALYPYGNAHEKQVGDKWQFDCQHGALECQMNLIETCALHLLGHPNQFMPYIHCVEKEATVANAKQCAEDLHVEWSPIEACYNGSEGNFLEHVMAEKTDALVPKHTYVPWIVVDGQHTESMQTDAQVDLIPFLCKTYKGEKPPACKDAKDKVCYKDNH